MRSALAEIDLFHIDDVSIGIQLLAFPFARRFDHFLCPTIHPPPGESALAESHELFSVLSEMFFMYIDGVSIGIRLFTVPSARGFAVLSARTYLSRPGNPLWLTRMNDSAL